MKLMILGAGAVGSYFGAALALAGHDVTFAVRAASSRALRENGVTLEGPRGTYRATNIHAASEPEEIIDIDVVLSCVKLYDAESSARQWRPALEKAGAVVSLQNGIDGRERILAGAPGAKVFGGLAFVSGKLISPGLVHYLSDMSSITFGGEDSADSQALRLLLDATKDSQQHLPVSATRVDDIRLAQWSKFLALATNAALTCLARTSAGHIYHDEHLAALAAQSVREILAVGKAEGIALTDAQAEEAIRVLKSLPKDMVASMRHDLDDGKRLELDGLSGRISELGKRHGIGTPFHDIAYACLNPHKNGRMT